MSGLSLCRVGSEWQSIEETLCYDICAEIFSMEIYQFAESTDSILRTLRSQTLLCLEVFGVNPIDKCKGLA